MGVILPMLLLAWMLICCVADAFMGSGISV